jgi:hypothetical protein
MTREICLRNHTRQNQTRLINAPVFRRYFAKESSTIQKPVAQSNDVLKLDYSKIMFFGGLFLT